jgi:hypothetical protein
MPWISSEIHYERVNIKKKTIFGWRRKLGYRLTKDLRYKAGDGVFYVLKRGYIWDGPSYPNWLSWIIGDKTTDGALAASAFHDIHNKIPARYVTYNSDKSQKMYYVTMSIKDGAAFYDKLLDEWPDSNQTVKGWQSNTQRFGLIVFQPIYRLLNDNEDWLLDE